MLEFKFAGITITMRSERYARLKAGILAGLLASLMLGFALWLFGYITGYRLAVAWLQKCDEVIVEAAHHHIENVDSHHTHQQAACIS